MGLLVKGPAVMVRDLLEPLGPYGPEHLSRSVAQPGSALVWGTRGRRFKSCRSDHFLSSTPAIAGPALRAVRSPLSHVHWTCSRASRTAAHPFISAVAEMNAKPARHGSGKRAGAAAKTCTCGQDLRPFACAAGVRHSKWSTGPFRSPSANRSSPCFQRTAQNETPSAFAADGVSL
jgi:hypothetical protein